MPISNPETNDLLKTSLLNLERWVSKNGWKGYDPYDIQGTGLYLHLLRKNNLSVIAVKKIVNFIVYNYPKAIWRLTGMEPRINPKAMGLFISAYCRLYELYKKPGYLEKSIECADWLLDHPSTGISGMGWGYPFDWQSVIFFPKWTPSAVVSTTVGNGLLDLYRLTGQPRYKNGAFQVAEFLIRSLNRTQIEEGIFCFSYTPLDHYLVHNANLLTAAYLARLGKQFNQPEWCNQAISSGNFALSEQNNDGSIFYWGKKQNLYNPDYLDCYHSGFEIRSLWEIWMATGDIRFKKAAFRYFNFFLDTYFSSNGEVKTIPGKVFPVDIHACAEVLFCTATLKPSGWVDINYMSSKVLPWIIKTMQNTDGSFAYKAYNRFKIDRTAYLRWNEAWMLRALSEFGYALYS